MSHANDDCWDDFPGIFLQSTFCLRETLQLNRHSVCFVLNCSSFFFGNLKVLEVGELVKGSARSLQVGSNARLSSS